MPREKKHRLLLMATNNRAKNPNEYGLAYRNQRGFIHITNNLGNRTRSRHAAIMNRFLMTMLSTNGIYELDDNGTRTGSPVTNWIWGNFGKRIGGRRSADGMIYSLPNAPMNRTGNNNVVAKFIFSSDNGPASEVQITNLLGKKRIGPKLFKCYSGNISMSLFLRNIGTNKLRVRNGPYAGSSFINLFQQFIKYNFTRQRVNRVFILIMENLYDNPSHGVEGGVTLGDIIDGKPGTLQYKIPVQQLKNKYEKMHQLGVVHGDMHPGNIVIQKMSRGRFGARIIDFGRSIYRPGVQFTNATARQAATNEERVNGLPRHKNNNMIEYVTRYARSARDTQKLTSGIVSLLNSAVRHHQLSQQRAQALGNQLLRSFSPLVVNFEQRRNAAQLAKQNAQLRNSLSKYNKSAQARILQNIVATLQRRKASAGRRAARGVQQKLATKQRRLRAARPPTSTGVRKAQLSYIMRKKNIEKEIMQSLQRRQASRVARKPFYNALIAQKLASAQARRAQSAARRAGIVSMNWEPSHRNEAVPMNWN
jgi:hypothetical protein